MKYARIVMVLAPCIAGASPVSAIPTDTPTTPTWNTQSTHAGNQVLTTASNPAHYGSSNSRSPEYVGGSSSSTTMQEPNSQDYVDCFLQRFRWIGDEQSNYFGGAAFAYFHIHRGVPKDKYEALIDRGAYRDLVRAISPQNRTIQDFIRAGLRWLEQHFFEPATRAANPSPVNCEGRFPKLRIRLIITGTRDQIAEFIRSKPEWRVWVARSPKDYKELLKAYFIDYQRVPRAYFSAVEQNLSDYIISTLPPFEPYEQYLIKLIEGWGKLISANLHTGRRFIDYTGSEEKILEFLRSYPERPRPGPRGRRALRRLLRKYFVDEQGLEERLFNAVLFDANPSYILDAIETQGESEDILEFLERFIEGFGQLIDIHQHTYINRHMWDRRSVSS